LTVKLYSYVVLRDYGFAPNPFSGYCTLATCKPEIRRMASVGDWVVGTGSATHNRRGNLVYAMKVAETMSFGSYWDDPRFENKKPNLRASTKLAFGDNIYRRKNGRWTQSDSHHSFSDGRPNPANISHDTQTDRVLIATQYAYWGGRGPQIPRSLRNFHGTDICKSGPGYKVNFPAGMEEYFLDWFLSLGAQGCLGRPIDWPRAR
jgi:hypothetical protein